MYSYYVYLLLSLLLLLFLLLLLLLLLLDAQSRKTINTDIWGKLPRSLKQCSDYTFKKEIKSHLISEQFIRTLLLHHTKHTYFL